MTKKQKLALEIISRLKKEYPDAGCTLDYNEAWKLLVSVRLAAQCTDARVNVVVKGLFEKYPDVRALADAPADDIEKIVKPCGLGHSKARDISACMKMLRDEYDCRVPDDFDELLKLPGVGRKSANLIMGDVYGKPAIVTDTHCIRLVNRMGLVDGITEPKKVEMALAEEKRPLLLTYTQLLPHRVRIQLTQQKILRTDSTLSDNGFFRTNISGTSHRRSKDCGCG